MKLLIHIRISNSLGSFFTRIISQGYTVTLGERHRTTVEVARKLSYVKSKLIDEDNVMDSRSVTSGEFERSDSHRITKKS
jgi:hypothetical protein